MKILSFSLDNSILDKTSLLAKSTVEYGNLVDQYIVLAPNRKKIKVELAQNVIAYGVSGFNKAFILFSIFLLANKIIKKEKINVITVQDPFEVALVGWLLTKINKINLNIQEHGDFFSEKYWQKESMRNYFRYYLGKFLIKRADSVRVVSKKIKKTLIKIGVDDKKIITVPVYTEVSYSEEENTGRKMFKEIYKKEFLFLTMGRMVKQKNILLLIRSFYEMNDNIKKKSVLKIIGKGKEKKNLINLVKKLKLTNQVEFLDWTKYEDVWDQFWMAGAFVLPSNYEGWGRVIIEAAATKLPIIMTRVGCADEVIKNNESGIIIDIGDQEALTSAMEELVNNKEKTDKMGEKAQEAIKKLPNKIETLKLYKKSWEIAYENYHK
ncbi:MAG: glycosyltransferase family 4 protein [bacterium]